MARGLSKSRYTQFKCCEKALWLGVFKPELTVIDDAMQSRFDTGSEVGDLAMGLLGPFEEMTITRPDGHLDYGQMIEKTQDALARGVENICEAAFSFEGNYCAVDILHKTASGYEIYEVKSSTNAGKDIYGWDIAYQKYVLTGCGLNIIGTYLVCINNQYVRQGELEIDKFFKIEDLKEAVDVEFPNVAANIRTAKAVLDGDEPQKPVSNACRNPYECVFREYCFRGIPKPSVLNLMNMDYEDRFRYFHSGIITFEQAEDLNLTPKQRMQVECTLNGEERINKTGIQNFLNTLWYPMYFLDFESIMPAIPIYDGTRPYQQLSTQYSLHYKETKDGELHHTEYLAPSTGNPLRPLAEQLSRDIPSDACVIVYNKGFERTRIKEMADAFPDLADKLLAIRENVRDLYFPFNRGYYYLPSMGSSFSIKSVLPALFPEDPELDYHALDELCQNGGMAMNLFPNLKDMEPKEERRARQALLDYCRLDTLAMVKVLDKLRLASL